MVKGKEQPPPKSLYESWEMAQNGEKEVRCRNAVINGEFGKGGGVCQCYYKTKLSVVAMVMPCLLYTELSHGLPSALLLLGFGAFPRLLDSQSGRQEAVPQHSPARYGYFKLYEITGNLDLVSGITW